MRTYAFWSHVPTDFEGKCYITFEPAFCWFTFGRKRHRLDGPAVIKDSGTQQWWINNIPYTEEQYWLHPLVIQKTLSRILSNDCVDNG